ncbi:MAG: hypothetical protein GX448_00440, partial [Planctomycetes bacterium]|nr:hypothetical protein [Planctomycetota bacterium]
DLLPWDGPDYGLDEQWARIHPYGQEVKAGQWTDLAVKILNHSPTPGTFTVTLHAPEGCEIEPTTASGAAAPGREIELPFRLRANTLPTGSLGVVTADIRTGAWDLRQWCESLVKLVP